MPITSQTFKTLVSNMVASIQGSAATLIDLTTGSILLAVTQATCALAMWLQGIAIQIAALTRFASSVGAAADSWAADFGFTRIGALFAVGQVTFSRFTNTNQASIPLGTIVSTADGTQPYTVIADMTQSAYNATLQAYIIAVSATSAVVTVQSVNAAAAANVSAGAISLLSQAIPYVDTVSNALAFTSGADAEADASFKTRFVAFLAALAKATKAAINYAISLLGPAVNNTLTENYSYSGTWQPGYFYAIVDDGTGRPSDSFISTASNAIDAVRPFTVQFGVFKPTLVTANVNMTLTTATGYIHSVVTALVQTALAAYINTLQIGADLPYTILSSIAYGVPGVINVTGITLNSGTSDLTATSVQIIKSGTLVVA